MRIVLIGLLSLLVGVAVYCATVFAFFRQDFTGEDIVPIVIALSVASVLAFSLIVAPGMFWLRRRLGGYKPAYLFPVSSTLFLGIPALVLIGLALFIFGSVTAVEASLFLCVFLIMGATFGLGFVWLYGRRTS